MSPLGLLHALHRHPDLAFRREGEALRVLPRVPEEARPVLAHFKPALLRALEGGERVEARALLSSPWYLAALLGHALGVEEPVMLTLYEEGEPRRYLAPGGTLGPHLAWAHRNLPPPHRLHLSPATGGWAVDWRNGWEMAVEALAGGTRYLLLLPALEARAWLEAAGKGLAPGELSVWRPGEEPFTARGWREALDLLEEVAHAAR